MSRRTFQRIIALAIVAGLIIGGIVLFSIVGRDSAEREARQFLQLVIQGEGQASYERASGQLREQVDQEEWVQYVDALQGKLGAPELVAQKDSSAGTKFYAYSSLVRGFSHTYVVELEDSEGSWKVRHIDIELKSFDEERFFSTEAEE